MVGSLLLVGCPVAAWCAGLLSPRRTQPAGRDSPSAHTSWSPRAQPACLPSRWGGPRPALEWSLRLVEGARDAERIAVLPLACARLSQNPVGEDPLGCPLGGGSFVELSKPAHPRKGGSHAVRGVDLRQTRHV